MFNHPPLLKEPFPMSSPFHVRKAVITGFLASLALSLIPAVAYAAPPTPKPSPGYSQTSEDKRYIVRYENDVNAEIKSNALEDKGIEVKDTISHAMQASVVVANPAEIESLKASADVAFVELDTPVSINASTSIWGLDRVDQRSGRDGQYNTGEEGAGVNVYVLDSGINTSHVDFSGRLLPGWTGVYDGRGIADCNGHGTHVAGTVAGSMYGVAKKANIVPLRALDCEGFGWSSTIVAGIDWAIAHHQPGQPAVMNMSVGGFSAASLDYAVHNAINDGITVVAASGNSNQDACLTSPAKVGPAITVAATDINDWMASFANYGYCVDIQAPGVSIRSAWNNAPTGYNTLSGTSMAAPHVAGAAAIMLSRTRSLTPAQVHQKIIEDSTVGVINGNRGGTPNRMLFIPALTGPSCSNLQLGQAWAGVGLTCKPQGGTASSDEVAPVPATAGESADAGIPFTPVIIDDMAPSEGIAPAEPAKVTPAPAEIAPVVAPATEPESVILVPETTPASIDAIPAPEFPSPAVSEVDPVTDLPAPVESVAMTSEPAPNANPVISKDEVQVSNEVIEIAPEPSVSAGESTASIPLAGDNEKGFDVSASMIGDVKNPVFSVSNIMNWVFLSGAIMVLSLGGIVAGIRFRRN